MMVISNFTALSNLQTGVRYIRPMVVDRFSGVFSNDQGTLQWVILMVIVGWTMAIITLILTSHMFPAPRRRHGSRTVFFAAFQEKVRRRFQSQSEGTFRTLIEGTNRILGYNPEAPTVFLFLVPTGAMPTATRLVTLLTHATLVAFNYPSSLQHIKYLFADGDTFTSYNDEWPFYQFVKRRIRRYGIAVVFAFEKLHPQAVRNFLLLVPSVFAPYPESVVMLVADIGNRFTDHQKATLLPLKLGEIFLRDLFTPYFDQTLLPDLINHLVSRCILVHPEAQRSHDELIPV